MVLTPDERICGHAATQQTCGATMQIAKKIVNALVRRTRGYTAAHGTSTGGRASRFPGRFPGALRGCG
ncbi:tannase/feruloyl esterase family alpha/beta hydrolase (plasmid) [Azospirillum brasilense]|uniref:Tannase/feruloyl esterase family alpha/beta hydrolase n=1 Tax=Azospirillum brasilense TaxID=192 RepID=A0A4D8R5M4_AZOBR|nr:tannase/feruloyl esterase family alpha/beta hydrolase [Azospirillum brasilense]